MKKITITGSGNVAQHLIKEVLRHPQLQLLQVWARHPEALEKLQLPSNIICTNIQLLQPTDICILAVSDNGIAEVSDQLPFNGQLVVHTSGTLPFSVLNSRHKRGVFYPLQTFTKEKDIDFKSIPFCLETEYEEDFEVLEEVAQLFSEAVYKISGEQRKNLHVAAVFVNNFVNHLYTIGSQICSDSHIPFAILKPLIKETTAKLEHLTPFDAQTGPAVRHDTKTIEKHLDFITDSLTKTIYQNLTQSIQNYHVKKF